MQWDNSWLSHAPTLNQTQQPQLCYIVNIRNSFWKGGSVFKFQKDFKQSRENVSYSKFDFLLIDCFTSTLAPAP